MAYIFITFHYMDSIFYSFCDTLKGSTFSQYRVTQSLNGFLFNTTLHFQRNAFSPIFIVTENSEGRQIIP